MTLASNKPYKITILPGDGIGPEIMAQAEKIIEWLNANTDIEIQTSHGLIGGASIDVHNNPLTDETIDECRKSDAILLGAVGGPKWDNVAYNTRPEAGLLKIRKELGLFANLRPAKLLDALADASALKTELVKGLDILIVRELTGGLYFGTPRGIKDSENGSKIATDTCTYSTEEIERIARIAFETARQNGGKVTSCDKANVLATSKLWRETVTNLHQKEYSNIELEHILVDNCAMQLVRNPKQFNIIVTDNLFGDILSDQAAMLTGSLGMLPSASTGAKDTPGLYEPSHGSAPDIAGQNIANPLATILSLAMCLRHSFARNDLAQNIEDAISEVLDDGIRTSDIMSDGCKKVTTSQMGEAVISRLDAT